MSSSKSNTKRTRSSNSGTLKQGTLAFPATKRTSSNTSSTSKANKPVTRTKSAPSPVQVEAIDSSSISSEDEERIESDEYVDTPARAVSSSEQKKVSKAADKGKTPLRSRANADGSAIDLRADNPGKWRKHYGEVREKMGNLEPIHAEDQNKVNYILHVFDMSYEYGPCIGVTRLARWERAQALGLNPPIEVHEILSTKQGMEEDEFKNSVLYGMV